MSSFILCLQVFSNGKDSLDLVTDTTSLKKDCRICHWLGAADARQAAEKAVPRETEPPCIGCVQDLRRAAVRIPAEELLTQCFRICRLACTWQSAYNGLGCGRRSTAQKTL